MSDAEQIPADNLTRDGAADLARRLTAYWHREGYPHARFWVSVAKLPEAITPKNGSRTQVWVVRSNLVRGTPPRRPT